MRVTQYILTLTSLLFLPYQLVRGQTVCNGYPAGNVNPGNYLTTDPVCAPVKATWEIIYSKVNDGGVPSNVAFEVEWGDGTYNMYTYVPGPHQPGVNDNEVHLTAPNTYKAILIHTYPPTGNVCSYQPRVYLNVSGTRCLNSSQSQDVSSWNVEDQGTGEMLLNEQGTGRVIVPVCEGEGAAVTFQDNSTFNCNPTDFPDNPNVPDRYIQFVYGTFNNATYVGRNRIPQVSVGGAPVTDAAGNLIAGALYSTPQNIPLVATASGLLSSLITFPAGVTTNGQVFEVTLRNWNYCNPYDDPNIPGPPADPVNGDHTPVTTTALIEIITTPPDLSGVTSDFCIGSPLTVTVTPYLAGSVINWYSDLATTNLIYTGENFDASTSPTQVAHRMSNAVAGSKTYYVTEMLGSCESDPSPITFTVRNALTTTGPVTCSKAANLCPGESGITFSVPNNPPTQTYGGATEYVWTVPAGWTITAGQGTRTITVDVGTTTGSQTVSVYLQYATEPRCPAAPVSLAKTVNTLPGATLGPANLSYCSSQSSNNPDIDIYSLTGQTPFTIVYQWNGGANSKTLTNVSANVNDDHPTPWPGAGTTTIYTLKSITDASGCVTTAPHASLQGSSTVAIREALTAPTFLSGATSVCSGEQDVLYTLTASPPSQPVGGATRYRYQETNTSNTDTDWFNWNDGATGYTDYETDNDQIIDVLTHASQVTRRLRVRLEYATTVTSGARCETGYTNRDVTIYPLPNVVLTGSTTICEGSSANLNFTVTNGPVNISYTDGTSTFNLSGVNSTTASTGALTGTKTYTITSVTRSTAPACSGTFSGSATITVNPTPTAAISGGATICRGNTTDITFALTGVGPFDVVYRANGVNQPVLSGISNGYTLSVAPLTTTTYQLVSVQSSNAPVCTGTIDPATVVITVDQPPTNANAGTDLAACAPTITMTLGADPVLVGTGQWSLVSKPAGADDPVFSSVNSNTSDVTITSGHWGVYTLRWTTSNGVCPDSHDEVEVDFGDAPTVVDAGPTDNVCFPNYTLKGNTPAIGQGTWTYSGPVGGVATFDNVHDPLTDVTVSDPGTYNFKWTIKSGICPEIRDSVDITFKPIPVIDAIADIIKCPGEASGNIIFTADYPATTFTWYNDNNTVGIGNNGATSIASVTLVNAGDTNNVATITVHGMLDGCPAADITFRVNVKPRPVVNPLSDITFCPGDLVDVANFAANTNDGETFSWTNDETAINLGSSGTGDIPDFNAGSNSTGSNIVGNISVVATLNGCVSSPEDFTITVKPTPLITAIADTSLCPGVSFNPVDFTSTPSGATFSWSNSNAGIGLGLTGTNDLPTFTTAANTSGSNITGVITVSATLASCPAVNETFTITVKPQPVIDNIADISDCPGNTINVPAFTTNAGGGESFSWTNNNPSIGLGGIGTGNISFTAGGNTTGSNITGSISVTATRLGCVSIPKTFNITVKPTPDIASIANFEVCPGETVNPELTCSPSGTITWQNSQTLIGLAASGNGDINSFTAAINESGAAYVGTIKVDAVLNGCPAIQETFSITVKPKPVVNTITNQEACEGELIDPGAFVANTGGGETFDWTNTNTNIGLSATGSGNISYNAPANTTGSNVVGTISVRATLAGCQSDATQFSITVKPTPQVTAISDIEVCPNNLVSIPAFTANTGGGEVFAWTNDNTSIGLASASGTGNIESFNATANTTGAAVTANFSVTASKNGCVSPPESFEVRVKPTPQITPIGNVSFCPGESYSPAAFSSTPAGSIFSWTNSNTAIGLGASGSGNIDPFTIGINQTGSDITGIITVSAVLNSCPAANTTYSITVKPQPVVGNVDDISECPGQLVSVPAFTANTSGGEVFNWTNSNTLTGLGASGTGNIAFTAAINGTSANITGTVSVTATRLGCTSPTEDFSITVKPTPVINPISNITACPGELLNPELTSTPAGASFTWTNTQPLIGLAPSGTNDINAFNAATNTSGLAITGTVNISAQLNSCPASDLSFSITIKPTPVISDVNDIEVCPTELIDPGIFAANTGGGETFSWTNTNTNIGLSSSGSGSISPYNAPNNNSGLNYTGNISVTATLNSCLSDAETFTITVKPTPQVIQLSDISACPGDAIDPVDFTSTPAGASFTWTNTNTAIGLAASGTDQIVPFTASNNTTSSNFDAVVITTGTLNGCVSPTMTFAIRVKPDPVLNPLSSIVVCPGETISPTLFETSPQGSTFTWTNTNVLIGKPLSDVDQIDPWMASNSTADSIKAVFTVTPTLNSCVGDPQSFSVAIKPKPFLDDITDISVCPGETVTVPAFTTTPSGSTFTWTNSNTQNGLAASGNTHIAPYVAPANNSAGYYTGVVTARANLNGCLSNDITFMLTVKPTPGTNAISGVMNVCASTATSTSTQVYRTDLPNGTPGSTYAWSITASSPVAGEPATTPFNNSVIVDFSNQSWTGTLQVVETSFEGCVGSPRTAIIRSYEVPVIDAGPDTSICAGGQVLLGGFPTAMGGSGNFYYSWTPTTSLDDGTKANPLASPMSQTTYSLTVTDAVSACVSQPDYVTVQINPLPSAPNAINQTICYGEPTPDLTAIGQNIKWYLDAERTNLVSTDNPFATGYTAPGVYDFYATQTVNGCESTARKVTLTINAIPAKPVASDVTVCYGQSVPDLVSTGSGVQWFDDAALTHLVKTGNVFTTNQTDPATYTYYVTQTVNSCQSPADTVVLLIKPKPAAPSATDHTVCADQPIPVLVATGVDIRWYSDSFLNGMVAQNDTLNTGQSLPGTYTYYATQTVNGCQSSAKTVNLVIRPVPEIISAFATDETVCNSGDGKVTIIASGTPPLGYSINGGTSFALSGNFTNLANGNYPVAVQNNYGCVVYGDTLTISSGNAPSKPIAGTSAVYCEGATLANLYATPVSGGVITWYTDEGLNTPLSNGLTFTPYNTIGTTHYYVTETYGGCESQSTRVTITINPLPLAPVINDTIVCTGMGVPTLHAKGSDIFWYADAVLSQVVNYGNYFVTGVTNPGNYTWFLASSSLGCRGPVNDVTLTIQQTPPTPVGTSTTSCFGETLPDLTATGGNVIWYSNSTLTNQVHVGNTYTTGNTAPGDYRYYIVDDDGHCRSNASTVMQTIYPIPAKPTGLDRTICEGEPTPTLVASGATIKWYSDAGLTTFVGQGSILTVSHASPGTYPYYATQTLNNCQSPPDTVVLLIKPKPAAPVANDVVSCQGTPTPNLTATGSNLKWYYGPTLVGTGSSYSSGQTQPGIWTYFVSQTIDGCQSNYEEVQLTINPAPVFGGSNFTDQTACNSNDGTITVNAAGYAPLAYSIDDGANYQAGNFFNGLKNGLYPIMIRNGYGCTTPGDTVIIRDGGAPDPPYALRDTGYCMNETFEPLRAFASVGGILTWYSDWGLKNVIHLSDTLTPFVNIGTTRYYITETSGDCESEPTVLQVSINLVPNPPVSSDTTLCYGLPVPSLTAIGDGLEWFNSPALNPVIGTGPTFNTGKRDPGVYVYYVTQIIDGCRSQATVDSLVINPRPVVEFEPSVDQGCSPLDVHFTNTSTGTRFTWTFGDQTTDNVNYSPDHQYVNNSFSQKNYAVRLVAENEYGCSSNLTKYLTVFPAPNYAFSMVPDVACHPVNVNFLSPAGAANYDWTFGDNTSLSGVNNSPSKSYVNETFDRDTSYHITLTATSAFGCVATYHDTLLVHPKPDVSFTTGVQVSCNPFSPEIDNLSVGATKYRWDFGDNSPESDAFEPTHTYNNTTAFPASYLITLRGDNDFGCYNMFTQTVQVYPPLTASFTTSNAGCSPFAATLTNLSSGSNLGYAWTTTDGQFSGAMNPTFNFSNNTFEDVTQTIQLVIRSQYNCYDTMQQQVVVYATPNASFTLNPETMVYPETTVSITQSTLDDHKGVWQYSWDFGDGSTSNLREPVQKTYDTSGVYRVRLRVDGQFCFDTLSRVVRILLPPPIADFDSIPPACSPYTVTFRNSSIYAETYRWTFGDGSSSNKREPEYKYWDAGTYIVNLAIQGPGGSASRTRLVVVHPTPVARFNIAPTFVYIPNQPVKCLYDKEEGNTYEWDYGDSSPRDTLGLHYYQEPGQYYITMYVRTNTEPQCADSITNVNAVTAEVAGTINMPNAFRPTPGGPNGGYYQAGQNNNHIFYPPIAQSVIEYRLLIFNRWGQKLFETTDIKQGWDGYFDGKLCEQGVYVWRVEGKYANKQAFVKMGDVTLIR